MTKFSIGLLLLSLAACGQGGRNRPGQNGMGGGGQPDLLPPDPLADNDQDGTSIAAGDCNDFAALVGPNAVDVVGNGVDDDCDGIIDQAAPDCDASAVGKTDGTSLAAAIDQCDPKFMVDAHFNGPSDVKARAVVASFGNIKPMGGNSMVLLSSGKAADKKMSGYVSPQPGTEFNTEFANPEPTLMSKPGCGMAQPAMVTDYTEWVVNLKAPRNANSFSFNFQFFSAEYPEWVCSTFNDMFIVQMESASEFAKPTNICFDEGKNPITINNGFFTVCQNGGTAQTMNCKKPVSELAGTGYEDSLGQPVGGSTGWLTTTAPVTPGEEVTLHFMIFDEGDARLDSAVLIDNFKWSVNAIDAPVTIQ